MSASSEEIRSRITGKSIPEGHVIVGLWKTVHSLRLYVESRAGLREWKQLQDMAPFFDAFQIQITEKNPYKGGLFQTLRIRKDENYFTGLTRKADAGGLFIRVVPEGEVDALLQRITETRRFFSDQVKFIKTALRNFPTYKAFTEPHAPPTAPYT